MRTPLPNYAAAKTDLISPLPSWCLTWTGRADWSPSPPRRKNYLPPRRDPSLSHRRAWNSPASPLAWAILACCCRTRRCIRCWWIARWWPHPATRRANRCASPTTMPCPSWARSPTSLCCTIAIFTFRWRIRCLWEPCRAGVPEGTRPCRFRSRRVRPFWPWVAN